MLSAGERSAALRFAAFTQHAVDDRERFGAVLCHPKDKARAGLIPYLEPARLRQAHSFQNLIGQSLFGCRRHGSPDEYGWVGRIFPGFPREAKRLGFRWNSMGLIVSVPRSLDNHFMDECVTPE